MARLKNSLVAVALAGFLWLQVCNKIPMVNASCHGHLQIFSRCIHLITVPRVICSHQNADATCREACRDPRYRRSRFYSDQACCLRDGECCCLPVYRDGDDGGEEESSLIPEYRDPNNVIDYIGHADDGNGYHVDDDYGDYLTYDFVKGRVDDDEVSVSSKHVNDQGQNLSPPDENDDGENSSAGSNNDGENSLVPDNNGENSVDPNSDFDGGENSSDSDNNGD